MIQFILRSGLLEGQAIRLLWQCVVSTVLLKRNPLIDIKKRQYIRIHNLIDVALAVRLPWTVWREGLASKGIRLEPRSLHYHIHVCPLYQYRLEYTAPLVAGRHTVLDVFSVKIRKKNPFPLTVIPHGHYNTQIRSRLTQLTSLTSAARLAD